MKIESLSNAKVKNWNKLKEKKYRDEAGLFLIEGDHLIKEALKHINSALESVENEIPVDMIAIDIKASWELLGEITGESYQDELLDTLFSKFCLGK